MTISATAVRFDKSTMWVDLSDGRTIGVPLAWFPRLLKATPAQRKRVELSRSGLHWEALDEDISVELPEGVQEENPVVVSEENEGDKDRGRDKK